MWMRCVPGGDGNRDLRMAGKCRRNPENQQQYPIWRARERNLSLKRAEETGYIQDAGSPT